MRLKITGGEIIFDAKDKDIVLAHKWYVTKRGYVQTSSLRSKTGKTFFLHNLIMDAQKGKEIDHISGNKLDNRRKNLRYATRSQQMMNRCVPSHNTSGVKGVHFEKQYQKWIAEIRVGERRIRRTFINIKDAISARKDFEKNLFGEYVRKSV